MDRGRHAVLMTRCSRFRNVFEAQQWVKNWRVGVPTGEPEAVLLVP